MATRAQKENERFFREMDKTRLALTFEDVRLDTGYAAVMPGQVDLQSLFSRSVPLNVPLVSAAMDTVTEHPMAIALAKFGGLGIIHRSMSLKNQADEVARVKHHLNGRIDRPICVQEDDTIASILKLRQEKDYRFHSFLVVDQQGRLVGVLSGNDFDFCQDNNLPAAAVMSRELITASPKTTLDKAYQIMQRRRRKLLPIVDKSGRVKGLYTFTDLKRIQSGKSRHNVDSKGQLRVGAAVGTEEETIDRVAALVTERVDVIVIDTAHADSKAVLDTLRLIKRRFAVDVMVGNISQPESVERLIKAGADGIKVGQGPGSICTTRVVAGIGCPQVTAVYKCAQAAKKFGVPICADGGIRYSGDIPVAIGAGAHSIMMGGLLAGTSETPGETFLLEGKVWKSYRGMGSLAAMAESKAARERYGETNSGKDRMVPEGIEGKVPFRGDVADTLHQHEGGLRKGMGYVGAATIKELHTKARFSRLTSAGKTESHPHDVQIVRAAPNYST